MIAPESSSVRVVAIRGYSSVFMMVLFRQCQAFVALMRLVRIPSTHLATLACMASTWSCQPVNFNTTNLTGQAVFGVPFTLNLTTAAAAFQHNPQQHNDAPILHR